MYLTDGQVAELRKYVHEKAPSVMVQPMEKVIVSDGHPFQRIKFNVFFYGNIQLDMEEQHPDEEVMAAAKLEADRLLSEMATYATEALGGTA